MAAKNKKTATSPVEAPETVEAPAVAPELPAAPAAPVAPLVLPEQVLGWSNVVTLHSMHLHEQRELREKINALAVREKNEQWNEFDSLVYFSDMLVDYVIDKDAYEELRTGLYAEDNTRALVFAFLGHLKK